MKPLSYIFLFGALVAGRILMGKAWKALPDSDRLTVVNNFGATKFVSILPLLGLFCLYWLIKRIGDLKPDMDQLWFGSVVVVGLISNMWIVTRKLRELGLPQSYRRSVAIGYALSIGAIAPILTRPTAQNRAEQPADDKPVLRSN